ncbi:MAG: LysR family transcriptional regulator [Microthrixaceae bacterium]
MQVRQLEYVVAAVEEGSFTAAAHRCHVAQPSLSSSIASLERELGTPLFHRIGRTIRPTAACEDLLPRARDVLRSMAAVSVANHGARTEVTGRIDLGVQPTLAATVGVSLVAALRERHAGITVRMIGATEHESVADLVASGRCELGVGERSTHRDLRWRGFAGEAFVLALPPRTHAPEPPLPVLRSVPVVAPPVGTPTRRALDELCAQAHIRPDIVVEAEPRDALLPLVAAGVGAAVLPTSSIPTTLPPGVTVVELAGRRRTIGLLRRNAPLTPAADALWTLRDPDGCDAAIRTP